MIAVPKTKADRLASGDPRLSVEERYPSFSVYAAIVKNAVEDMVAKRLMLREDAQAAVDRLLLAGQATCFPILSRTTTFHPLHSPSTSKSSATISACPKAASGVGQSRPW
jgi:hypothetical protein